LRGFAVSDQRLGESGWMTWLVTQDAVTPLAAVRDDFR
jgi:hypothetical protein